LSRTPVNSSTIKPREQINRSSLRRLISSCPSARVITDKLRSYPVAFRSIGLTAEHIVHKRSNNRAENAHQPVRRRERKMQEFKSPGSAQRFLNTHSAVYNTFYVHRHLLNRTRFKNLRAKAFGIWQSAAGTA
jgi:transposase-like protein